MDWNVIALVFACVAMNHMGLITAIEELTQLELPIMRCVKCSVFWVTLVYGIYSSKAIIIPVAMAFLYSYSALWLELLMGYVDFLYLKCYEKIVSSTDADKVAADGDESDTSDTLSDV